MTVDEEEEKARQDGENVHDNSLVTTGHQREPDEVRGGRRDSPGDNAVEKETHPEQDDHDSVEDEDMTQRGHPGGDEKSQASDEAEVEHASGHEDEDGDPEENPDPASPPSGSQLSRVSSTFSRTAAIVPRGKRRGLLARFAIIPEVERPYDYKNKTKWIITATVAMAAIAAPLGSSIFYPALPQMSIDLHASPTVTNLTVALYMLSMSIFPLWWSSFSETLGRRTVYITSFTLFFVFSVLSAVSKNIAMLIVMRILAGGASASVQAVGAGTIADVWEPRERGKAMGGFYLGPLAGPLFAPIIGGALAQRWGWRSTMWLLTIYGGIMLPVVIFFLPETLPRRKPMADIQPGNNSSPGGGGVSQTLSRMSTRQSVKHHTKKAGLLVKRFIIDPLSVLLYLRFPPVLITVYYAAITFGSLFVLNISIQAGFSKPPYAFPELIVGLLYLPPSLGYILASLLGGRWIDHIMAREAQKAGRYDEHGKLVYLPEDRMRENAWLSATMYPAALIWYGWTVQRGVHWIVPCIANFFFGCGSMLVFGAATTMLTEFMPKRSSSGVAVNNFIRNIFSCVGAIVTQPLIDAMGDGWLFTMVGLVACLSGYLCIWALKRYGPRWRKMMDESVNHPVRA